MLPWITHFYMFNISLAQRSCGVYLVSLRPSVCPTVFPFVRPTCLIRSVACCQLHGLYSYHFQVNRSKVKVSRVIRIFAVGAGYPSRPPIYNLCFPIGYIQANITATKWCSGQRRLNNIIVVPYIIGWTNTWIRAIFYWLLAPTNAW